MQQIIAAPDSHSKTPAFDRHNEGTFRGIMAADWIRDLEMSDSRLHKEAVIEKALMAAQLGSCSAQCFLYSAYLALNPFFVYGVKKVPESAGLTDRENPWVSFWALCESLRTRSVTGGNAREAIVAMMARFDSEQWNGLARRVLIKDLRCGVSEKTINKICHRTEWNIPTFECQLAQDSTDQPHKLKGRRRLEAKLDGVRVLAMCYVNSGTVNLMSRNGKAFANFAHIEQQLIPQIKRMGRAMFQADVDFVLDGEIVGASFQALMRQAQRKKDVDASDSIYHVFDVMPMQDFYQGHCNTQQHKRLDRLQLIHRVLAEHCAAIQIMPGITLDLDTDDGHNIMRQFAEDAIRQGFEGIMIKDLDAPYECRRSSFWMKWKPTITVDLNITGFEEGTGRNQGRLGAIICEGVDNGRVIGVHVGSGLRDSDRDEFWGNRNNLLGRVIEVEADAVTQNQDGTHSLRFPRFVRFRGFEPGEKI